MIAKHLLRAAQALTLLLVWFTACPDTAMAAGSRHAMKPFLRLSSPEALSAATSSSAGPRYGLFSCQVGLSEGACYDPYQMRHAYQIDTLVNAGYDGSGKTIVILDAFQNPNIVAQLSTFGTFYGLPAANFTQIAPQGLTPFDQTNGDMAGWAEEISLDVEWSHAMAPGAKIVLVLAKSDQDADLLAALQYAISNHLGDVISMSFGENESCEDPAILVGYHKAFASATRKHITLFASSGDEGAALPSCDGNSWVKAVSTPADDPLVTGVGGTELTAAGYCLTSLGCDPTTNPAPGTYQGEIAWNEGPPFGDFQADFGNTLATGGGYSILFPRPSFQYGTVHHGSGRGVPDVAYNGAVLHGVLTYLDIPGIPAGYYRFGGTSAGAPQWSAITAIADQESGGALGFLNAAIYRIAQLSYPHFPATLHDVKSGVNSAVEPDYLGNPVTIFGFNAGFGWDATTGLGSAIASPLVAELIRFVSPGDGEAESAQSANSQSGTNARSFMRPH